MPLEKLTVYLDENHCNNRKVLTMLEKAGVHCERHLDHFPRGTPDEEWLAVLKHGVRMFYFSKNDMSGQQMGDALEMALPAMIKLYEKQPPPFFAAISKAGGVYLKEKFSATPIDLQL